MSTPNQIVTPGLRPEEDVRFEQEQSYLDETPEIDEWESEGGAIR